MTPVTDLVAGDPGVDGEDSEDCVGSGTACRCAGDAGCVVDAPLGLHEPKGCSEAPRQAPLLRQV